jgi:hypothetical protein
MLPRPISHRSLLPIRDLLTQILAARGDVIAEPKHPNRIKAAIDKDRRLAF